MAGIGMILAAATACGQAATDAPAPAPAAGNGTFAPPPSSPAPSSSKELPVPPPVKPGKPTQAVPEDSMIVQPAQIDATQLPADYPREVTVSNGGTVLNIRAQEGGCGHVSAAPIEQNDKRVVINLVQTQAQTDQMCTMDIRTPVITATLSAPLGQRTVVLQESPRKR
ncbi:hypothetical protein AB5J62_27410 [Amycolatopsis sp. cg5]|uniref:hypothetical protein n=1 Tax=Amycolatopsis sp. cg5 TaxID=3238802 RepID=UPI00352677B8